MYFVYVVDALLSMVFDEALLKTIPLPADLSSQYEGPPMEEVVARHVSRFRKGGLETYIMSSQIREHLPYLEHNTTTTLCELMTTLTFCPKYHQLTKLKWDRYL